MWKGVVIVHGRPRHPQSQGSIERADQDVEAMIGHWMKDNNSKNWVLALHFVQQAKNTRVHSGIKNQPYILQYGQRCRHGCASLPIDKHVLLKLRPEDDLNAIMTSIQFIMAEMVTNVDAADGSSTNGAAPPFDAGAIPASAPITDADAATDPGAIADTATDPDAIADTDADPDAAVTSAPALNHEPKDYNYSSTTFITATPITDAYPDAAAAETSPVVTGCNECAKCKNWMSRDYLCQGVKSQFIGYVEYSSNASFLQSVTKYFPHS
jgi:hypothetical protein